MALKANPNVLECLFTPVVEEADMGLAAVRQDFDTLTRDSLDTLRVLMTSLAAERRDDVLGELED